SRELEERGGHVPTEIIALNARILDVVTEGPQHVASVQFNGLVREDGAAQPQPFAEIWNLTKPVDGSSGWLLAGIQQSEEPLTFPALLADPRHWSEYVREDGDVALGGALKELAQTLPWFVEQAFARALGPIAGQRVADVGRRLLGFPEYAAERVTESVARYA